MERTNLDVSDPPFTCPYCDKELQVPEDAWYLTCERCGKRLNLESQFAYLRGLDAFSEGQDIMMEISPRQRRKLLHPKDKQAMKLFMEAYTAIQLAFQAELAEPQRSLGVEMMSSMAAEFNKRNMVSPLESSYWGNVMVEQTAQDEYDNIKTKIPETRGLLGWIKKLRWNSRQKQLLKSLVELDQKINTLEQMIEFVDIPHARKKKWRP